MKSRRLTLVCVAAIALVGTPRAWQGLGDLLSAAQQKAQFKFWSMVMRPSSGPAEVELVAVAETAGQDALSAHGVSPCTPGRDELLENFEPASYREVRRAASPAPSRPKAYTRRQRPEFGSLIAHAGRQAPSEKEGVEPPRVFKEKKDSDFEFLEVAENLPAPKAAPRARAMPVDTLTFAQLPAVTPVAAAAFSEKEVVYQFKLIKKPLNENCPLLRQRSRLPAVRIATSFPAS
ncbi:MAG TPA: hypothetical protein VGC87_25960 [Pyrinomonadaceae bacterium]|jgi:hypothetical protein